MPRGLLLVIVRVFVLVALAVSAALLHDYSVALPAFCEAGQGCEKIRQSSFASLGGLPTPLFGVTAFVVLYILTLLNHELRKRWMVPVAILGALFGFGFIGIQAFVEHTFCILCVIVDSSAVVAAIAALAYRMRASSGSDPAVPSVWWGTAGVVALFAPFLFAWMQPPPPANPAVVQMWSPGKINVVELSDFQCPFCELQHRDLKAALEPYGDKVHFVRIVVPLAGHPQARPAARAYLCAKDQNLGEEMADGLFSANHVTPEVIQELGHQLQERGLGMEVFLQCLKDPGTEARVNADHKKAYDEIHVKGLPTVWIGTELFEGRQDPDVLKRAVQRQASGTPSSRPTLSPVWLWSILIAGFVVLGVVSLRSKRLSDEGSDVVSAESDG